MTRNALRKTPETRPQFSLFNRLLDATWLRGFVEIVGGLARAGAIIFMLVPVTLVVTLSFSNEAIFRFPPQEWGFRQYTALWEADYWLEAIRTSFAVSVPAAFLTLVVAVPAAVVLNRGKVPMKAFLTSAGLAPLVIPSVAYAVALYIVFLQLGVVGSKLWLVVTYSVLSFPFVLLIVGSAVTRVPIELELVAMTLGARRRRAMVGITVRLLAPAIAASFVFALLHSFDEATFINFIGGPGTVTLPKAIYDSVRTGLDPVILAISTILMVATAFLAGIASYWRRGVSR